MWGYTFRVLDRDDVHRSGAGMSQKLALTAVVAVVAAIAGAVLVATVRPAPEVVTSGATLARPSEDAPVGAWAPAPVARKPRKGRVLSVADAAKELDLIARSEERRVGKECR